MQQRTLTPTGLGVHTWSNGTAAGAGAADLASEKLMPTEMRANLGSSVPWGRTVGKTACGMPPEKSHKEPGSGGTTMYVYSVPRSEVVIVGELGPPLKIIRPLCGSAKAGEFSAQPSLAK